MQPPGGSLKAYVVTTGLIFGVITLAHLWRMAVEWQRVVSEPFYLFLTVLAAALCGWAFSLVRERP